MALNLLCSSYGSDDDLSDCDTEPSSSAAASSEGRTFHNQLVAEGNVSDTSSSESDTESPKKKKQLSEPEAVPEPPPKRRLPSATEVFSTQIRTGVLINQYERAAMEHEAMLSRHVPLTDPKLRKPVCKAFRRGQCRRGKNCRYDHPEEEPKSIRPDAIVTSAPIYKTSQDISRARPPKSRF